MKKTIMVMMLATGITGAAFAQNQRTVTEKTFEIDQANFERKFTIDLEKGNKAQIELKSMEDLDKIKNLDSLLAVFMQDLKLLKDSLPDDASSVRIDYIATGTSTKTVRIVRHAPQGSSFVIRKNDLAALKLEQDTINFIGIVPFVAKYTLRKPFDAVRFYKVSLFVNNLSDLETYAAGKLNDKVAFLQQKKMASRWVKDRSGNWHVKNGDQSVSAKNPAGYIANQNDFITTRLSANAQNYKNYFVPSFNLGVALTLTNEHFKREIGLSWEPNFLFAKNANGKLTTYRNDFVTLTFGQGMIKDNDAHKESPFISVFSLSYLTRRKGDFFEKNTIRLGAGQLSLFEGKTKIEPMLYFTNLFKGVTPGIRLTQQF
jgi:hypothetical protein